MTTETTTATTRTANEILRQLPHHPRLASALADYVHVVTHVAGGQPHAGEVQARDQVCAAIPYPDESRTARQRDAYTAAVIDAYMRRRVQARTLIDEHGEETVRLYGEREVVVEVDIFGRVSVSPELSPRRYSEAVDVAGLLPLAGRLRRLWAQD
jgi:hypothetical protein